MKSENEDAKLDDLISKAIGNNKSAFDFAQWKEDHPEDIAAFKEQTAGKSHKPIKYASIILSAAAMILLVFMLQPNVSESELQIAEYSPKILTAKIKLPDNVATIAKLNFAFEKGGMEAVDTFYEQTVKRTGPRPEKMTVRQLLKEMETDSNKTKGNNHENRSYNISDDISDAA